VHYVLGMPGALQHSGRPLGALYAGKSVLLIEALLGRASAALISLVHYVSGNRRRSFTVYGLINFLLCRSDFSKNVMSFSRRSLI
jgi:hypothetical protein